MTRCALLAVAVLAAPSLAVSQSDVLWRYQAPADIKFTHVDVAGNLLVVMDSLLVALDAAGGKPSWTVALASEPRVFRNVLDAYFLIGFGRDLLALDPVSGDTVWRRADLPDLKKTAVNTPRDLTLALMQTHDGFATLDLTTGRTIWDSTSLPPQTVVREYFMLQNYNLLILLARTPRSDVSLLGLTLDSGRVLWRHDSLFGAKPKFMRERGVENITDIQAPRMMPDTSLLIYFSADGPMRLDPRSGAVRWRGTALADKPVGGWQEGYPAPVFLDDLVFVATEKSVVAFTATTGELRWRAEREFRERPTWMVARSSGLLVGGFGRPKQFLTALDPATGKRVWPRDLEPKGGANGYIHGDTVYLTDDGVFWSIPLATGKADQIAMIGFEGKEHVAAIDTIEGGFVLSARQNIMRIGTDGKLVYRKYYKAPGASFLAKLASTALLVALNVASYSAAPPGGTYPVFVRNPLLAARYGSITEAMNYFYIFTETPDPSGKEGYSLVLLDRRDGKELGRLWFDERSPDYTVDRITGTVYEREGREIVARRLRAPGAN